MMDAESRRAQGLAAARQFASDIALDSNEVLILTGSATLPFDSTSSDVDLVLVTPHQSRIDALCAQRCDERLSEQLANGYTLCYLPVGTVGEIDVETWHADRVGAVCATFRTTIRGIDSVEADFTRIGGLDVKVGTDLMHAIGWGVAVAGEDSLAALRESMSWPTYQAFKRDTALVNVRDAVKGITRSLREHHRDEAYLKLCWAADSLVDALIFDCGLSITRWKWRLRYLDQLPLWVGDWYRSVRFSPSHDAKWLARQVDVLQSQWSARVGQAPHQVRQLTRLECGSTT